MMLWDLLSALCWLFSVLLGLCLLSALLDAWEKW